MGDIGGIIGGVLGTIFGNPMGTFGGIFAGSEIENKAKQKNDPIPTSYPDPVDYSDVERASSNNSKTVADAQIESQKFQMQQSSIDRELQHAANLELGLDKFDTKLQVSKLEYIQQMTAESNRHVEKMAADGSLPPPETEV